MGDILVDIAISKNNPQKDRLFFPICYNYRHFIELCLKHLILKSEELYFILKCYNMQNKECQYEFKEEVNNTHNIEKLLNRLTMVLNCISDDKFSTNIIKSILEFHEIDRTGQAFRYPKNRDDILHFEIREEFDLTKIKMAINEMGNYLMGIDIYLELLIFFV